MFCLLKCVTVRFATTLLRLETVLLYSGFAVVVLVGEADRKLASDYGRSFDVSSIEWSRGLAPRG